MSDKPETMAKCRYCDLTFKTAVEADEHEIFVHSAIRDIENHPPANGAAPVVEVKSTSEVAPADEPTKPAILSSPGIGFYDFPEDDVYNEPKPALHTAASDVGLNRTPDAPGKREPHTATTVAIPNAGISGAPSILHTAAVRDSEPAKPPISDKTLIQTFYRSRPETVALADRDIEDWRNRHWEVLNITVAVVTTKSDVEFVRVVTLEWKPT